MKFNKSTENRNLTVNKSGHVAYKMSDKATLTNAVLTSFFNEAKFYGDTSNEIVRLAEKIAGTDPRFVSNLARYARKVYHLRSVAHVLTCIVAKTVESKPFIKETVYDVVERPDDILEILSCYLGMYGKPIPNGLKKAVNENIKRFNEFSIAKYNSDKKSLTFKDVLSLTHPKPENEAEEYLFNAIMNDTLKTPITWETQLSARGNTKEVWEELIDGNKLGYMAMLRNLNNILNAKVDNIQKVYDKLSDEQSVLKSKQLPFRFMSAYKAVSSNVNRTNKVFNTIEQAAKYSVQNLPRLEGKTVIAIDTSGSMGSNISGKSEVKCSDIAALLGVLASKICDEFIIYTFDTTLKRKDITSSCDIISTAMGIAANGGGTNLKLPLEEMLGKEIYADRFIILSDNEINSNSYWGGFTKTCQSLVDQYRNTVNKDLWVHAIDLQGYGTQQFIGGKTNIIAGWSDRVLEYISKVEGGLDNQVKDIEKFHEK